MKKLFLMIPLILIGCGKSAPKCDSSESTDLVIEIAEDALRPEIVRSKFPGYYLNTVGRLMSGDKKKDEEEDTEIGEKIDEIIKKLSLTVTNIRINSVDDKLLKSECSADLTTTANKKHPITYSLTYNTEGELYAEVTGLR